MLKILFIVLIFSILNIAIVVFIRKIFPASYFSLGQFVDSYKNDITYRGLIIRFLPPFILAIILSMLLNILKVTNIEEYIITFGFLSSFLIVWPVFLIPDQILSPEAYRKLRTLYFIYLMFIITHVIITDFGFFIYSTCLNIFSISFISKIFIDNFDLKSIFNNLLSAGLYSILGLIFIFAYHKYFKDFFEHEE